MTFLHTIIDDAVYIAQYVDALSFVRTLRLPQNLKYQPYCDDFGPILLIIVLGTESGPVSF
jgi:hypothetical protein